MEGRRLAGLLVVVFDFGVELRGDFDVFDVRVGFVVLLLVLVERADVLDLAEVLAFAEVVRDDLALELPPLFREDEVLLRFEAVLFFAADLLRDELELFLPPDDFARDAVFFAPEDREPDELFFAPVLFFLEDERELVDFLVVAIAMFLQMNFFFLQRNN